MVGVLGTEPLLTGRSDPLMTTLMEVEESTQARMLYTFMGVNREVEVLRTRDHTSLVRDPEDIGRGEFWVYTRHLRALPAIDEGDDVLLRAKVYRVNREQALIEFTSMEGPYSIRVPLSELRLA